MFTHGGIFIDPGGFTLSENKREIPETLYHGDNALLYIAYVRGDIKIHH